MTIQDAKNLVAKFDFDEALVILQNLDKEGNQEAKTLLLKTLKQRAADVNSLGDAEFELGHYREAMNFYKKSLVLIEKTEDRVLLDDYSSEYKKATEKSAQEINDKGDKFLAEKNYDEAISTYQESVELMEIAQNHDRLENFRMELNAAKTGKGKMLLEQAISQKRLQKWEEAAELFNAALKLVTPEVNSTIAFQFTKELENMYQEWGQLINNQGDQAFKQKNYALAIELYAESVKLATKSNKPALVLNFKQELSSAIAGKAQEINCEGDELYKRGQYEKAAELYANSVNVAAEAGNQKLVEDFTKELNKSVAKMAQEVNNIGDQEFKNKNYEAAARHYKKSIDIAIRSNNPKIVKNFSSEYEKALEMWAIAFVEKGLEYLKSKGFQADAKKEIPYFEKAREIVAQAQNDKLIAKIDVEICNVYKAWADDVNKQGDGFFNNKLYSRAAEIYQQSVWLAEKARDMTRVGWYTKELEKSLRKMKTKL